MGTEESTFEVVDIQNHSSAQEGDKELVTLTVRGDRALLERLLRNLLPEGESKVRVSQTDLVEKEKRIRDPGKRFRDYWKKVQPGRRKGLLAAACFLHQSGHEYICRAELEHLLAFLSAKERPLLSQRSLIHLARCGYIERRKRGVYIVKDEGLQVIEAMRERQRRKRSASPKRAVRSAAQAPRLDGISPFLRSVPSSTLWLKTLLCAYFLRRFCGVEEFNREMLVSCFKRVRGLQAPGSLPAVLSQVLFKQYGYIAPCKTRGFYTITAESMADLRERPYVRSAERKLERIRPPVDEADENLSNQDQRRFSA
jgi:hypothetical protein